MLGLSDEASGLAVGRLDYEYRKHHRFAVFLGPFDYLPDGCTGGVMMTAVQRMLMQTEKKKITLFPAWPKNWDVSFKLHAPRRTTVEGEYKNGRLERCVVTPPQRKKDLVTAE